MPALTDRSLFPLWEQNLPLAKRNLTKWVAFFIYFFGVNNMKWTLSRSTLGLWYCIMWLCFTVSLYFFFIFQFALCLSRLLFIPTGREEAFQGGCLATWAVVFTPRWSQLMCVRVSIHVFAVGRSSLWWQLVGNAVVRYGDWTCTQTLTFKHAHVYRLCGGL